MSASTPKPRTDAEIQHTLAVMKAVDSHKEIPKAKETPPLPKRGKQRNRPLTDPKNRWRDKFLVERMRPDAKLPTKGTVGSVGYDMYSYGDFVIPARSSSIVSTQIRISLPANYYGRIASRSGHAFKHDLQVHPGTIDNDYLGEIKVKIFNHSDNAYVSEKGGERICQLIVEGYKHFPITEIKPNADNTSGIESLVGTTKRGSQGFGSTGKK